MTLNHTPGPWRCEPIDQSGYVDIYPPAYLSFGSRVPVARRVHSQDAAIIAAAPELLAALREATRCLAWHAEHHPAGMDCAAVEKARAALAKATGEAA